MTLPTKIKTWEGVCNQALAGQATALANSQLQIFNMKQMLCGELAALTTPWVVVQSKDAKNARVGYVDYWTSPANITTGSSAKYNSWCVLRQPGLDQGSNHHELLIFCNTLSYLGFGFYFSEVGFGEGATDMPPTGSALTPDINTLYAAGNTWFFAGTSGSVWNLVQSSDGQCSRIWGYNSGSATMGNLNCHSKFMMMHERLTNCPPATTTFSQNYTYFYPAASLGQNGRNAATSVYLGPYGWANVGNYNIAGPSIYFTEEGVMAYATPGTMLVNEISTQVQLTDVGVLSAYQAVTDRGTGGVGASGKMGNLQDCWWGPNDRKELTVYNDGALATDKAWFVQISGGLVFPWPSGTLLLDNGGLSCVQVTSASYIAGSVSGSYYASGSCRGNSGVTFVSSGSAGSLLGGTRWYRGHSKMNGGLG